MYPAAYLTQPFPLDSETYFEVRLCLFNEARVPGITNKTHHSIRVGCSYTRRTAGDYLGRDVDEWSYWADDGGMYHSAGVHADTQDIKRVFPCSNVFPGEMKCRIPVGHDEQVGLLVNLKDGQRSLQYFINRRSTGFVRHFDTESAQCSTGLFPAVSFCKNHSDSAVLTHFGAPPDDLLPWDPGLGADGCTACAQLFRRS
jgi:hypothetical protein